MTLGGILMMGFSYLVVLWLTAFCFYKVMVTPNPEETQHAPLEIDTGDEDPAPAST